MCQEWGSPDSVISSGFLAVSSALAESQISVAMDGTEIQASVALKKNRVQKITIMIWFCSGLTACDESCMVSLLLLQEINEAWFNMSHSVPLLRKLGLPVQAGIRVNSANHGNGSYSYMLNCSAGSQKVGGRIRQTSISGDYGSFSECCVDI